MDRLAERYAQAKVIYLGGNDLLTVHGFEQFQHLLTLSLSNNLLTQVSDLYVLAGACPTLRNLSLEGNAVAQTPYYRQRVIAGTVSTVSTPPYSGIAVHWTHVFSLHFILCVCVAMPELELLDGTKVTDDELRGAVDVERKYATSMDLLFQNDCLIHKLKRVTHQIGLHSDLHAVRHGLRRGSIGSKIPITVLRSQHNK